MRTLIAIVLISTVAAAQTQQVEVEPITCWWRTSAHAVRAGEPFTVVLTCSVLQTEAARAIPDESRLDPAVVQLPPFEVVGGSHAKDIVTAGRRFIQYSYQARVLEENVFDSVVSLPALEITYRVESRVPIAGAEGSSGAGDVVAGRDQSYALPPLAIRVLSIVPDTADDIREAPVATFGEIEETGFRASLMRVGGWLLVALGVLLFALALLGLLRRRRVQAPKARRFSDAAILAGVRRELAEVQARSRGGWTSELAGRALAALRVVAAYAEGRPVAQQVTHAREDGVLEGQLRIPARFGGSAVVSAAVTAEQSHSELHDALARFAAARYGRSAAFDATLDEGLDTAVRTADRLLAARPVLERLWAR
jgi:hypothetical protein